MKNLKLHLPPLYTAATAVYPYSPALDKHFIVATKYSDPICLARKVGGFLHIPRELAPLARDDRRSAGSPISAKCLFDFKPDNYEVQKSLFDQSFALLERGKSHVLNATMGVGKSYLGTRLACELGVTTLIVVTKEDLMIQWKQNILKYTDCKEEDIGIIQQDTCQVKGKKFVIGMVHSISNKEYPAYIYDYFGLVILDECFHPDHELLVEGKGWVSVAQVDPYDRVMSFNAESDSFSFEQVIRTISKPFSGNLVEIKGRSYHTLTTPKHEQPIKRERGGSLELDRVTVADLHLKSRVRMPVAGYISHTVSENLTAFEKLRIAFEADGNLLYTAKTEEVYTYRFAFRKQRKIDRLQELLESCEIPYKLSVNARGDTNISFKLATLLTKDFGWFDPYQSSVRNTEFLHELTLWDGWSSSEGFFWDHLSQDSAEFVMLIAKLCGRESSVIKTNHYEHRNARYRVRWFKEKTWTTPKSWGKTEIPYTGTVHCVTVPSGNVLTRYKGKLSISGNCHRMSANYFCGVMFKFNSMVRLGLSATTRRPDGKSFVFNAHIGEIGAKSSHVHLSPKVIVVESSWKLPKWRVKDPITGMTQLVDMPHKPGKIAHVVKAMSKDDDRNHLIADLALKAYNKDRHTVIFFDQLDHIAAVLKLLATMGVPPTHMSKYVGGMTDAQRKEATKKRILLATYIYMSEGTDVPHLDTAILASPRSNIMQSAGRILRAHEGKKEPVIIDIVDVCSKVLVNAHHSRMRQYNELKATIVKLS